MSGAEPLSAAQWRAVAALLELPDGVAASDELSAAPALAWLVDALRPRTVLRLGLGQGAALAVLARAAERAPGTACLALPAREGEPEAAAARVARDHPDALRLVADAAEARRAIGDAGAGLLSLGAGAGAAALAAWREVLAPAGAVSIDAPDARAADRAWGALREALGSEVPAAALGGVVVAAPGALPDGALATALRDPAGLSALLGRMGRALLAQARAGEVAPDEAALREDLARARALAEALQAEGDAARDRALAAMREAEALRERAAEEARRRSADDAALARALAERERELHHARSRLRDMEKEARRLSEELDARFHEIAALTSAPAEEGEAQRAAP